MTDVSSATRRQDRTSEDYYLPGSEGGPSGTPGSAAGTPSAKISPLASDLPDLPWTDKSLPAAAFARPAASASSASASSAPAEHPIGLRLAPKDLTDAQLATEKNDLEMRAAILKAVPNDGRIDPGKVAGRLAALTAESARRDQEAHACDTARPTLVHQLPQHAVFTADELAACGTKTGMCLTPEQKTELEKVRQATCRDTGRDPFVYATKDADTVSTDRAALAAADQRKRIAILNEVASNPLAAAAVIGTAASGGTVDQAYDGVQASAATWGVATALSGAVTGDISERGTATRAEPTRVTEEHAPSPATPINDRHIFGGEVGARGKASGVHLEPRGRFAATAQIVEGTSTSPGPDGVYQAKVKVLNPTTGSWVKKSGMTTLFPRDWSAQDVRDAIREANDNRLLKKEDQQCNGTDTDPSWIGRGPNGIKIKGVTDPRGRIITGYPLKETSVQ